MCCSVLQVQVKVRVVNSGADKVALSATTQIYIGDYIFEREEGNHLNNGGPPERSGRHSWKSIYSIFRHVMPSNYKISVETIFLYGSYGEQEAGLLSVVLH